MAYELYYWPSIQGRGEFVRLTLEEAGADYVDVARNPAMGGVRALLALLADESLARPPFAPPFLRSDGMLIAQTANILDYLGGRHGLTPRDEAARRWTLQLQLTIADLLVEVHDTHHPIAASLYYEDQQPEAVRRSADFVRNRLPKYLDYFERVLRLNSERSTHLVGNELTYVDLSLFQVIEGARYAFPRTLAKITRRCPRIMALHDGVAARPRIAAYLASARRLPFSEQGIFRHYAELDVA